MLQISGRALARNGSTSSSKAAAQQACHAKLSRLQNRSHFYMFKKPITINQTHKVSGADRKKIRRSVEKALQLDSCDDGSLLEQLLPAKAGELEVAKLPAPSRLCIYSLDGVPVFLDLSGKNDFIPTVMGLWACPQLLPVITVKHPAVSQYIWSGADLMLPGVDTTCLPEFQKGALLAICVPGNPCPIAVGSALMHSTAAAQQAAGQGKGKLVEVIQHYGDTLWQSMGKQATPNAGFLQGVVVSPDVAQGAAQGGAVEALQEATSQAADELQQLGIAEEASTAEAASGSDGQQDSAAAATTAAGTSSSNSTSALPDDMDQLLELALLQALTKSVKDGDLPLNSTALWSHHIKPSAPPGVQLDAKKSSHKKMSKFLQVYTKAGLLNTKEDKHSGDTILTAVNRSHALLADFRPYKTSSSSSSAVTPETSSASAAGDGVLEPLIVEEVYRPSKETKPVFEAVGASPDGYYSAPAAAEVAFAYAKAMQLDSLAQDNKTWVLDATLCDALYKGAIRKGELYPTHIAKAELREAFLKRLQPQTCISRGQQRLLRKGAPPAVQISGERRQGNKYVTRVVGMEAFLIDPAALAARCQKKYACSTSVNDLPGKNNPGQEVILQGNVIEKLPEYLINTYGIPKKYFMVKK